MRIDGTFVRSFTVMAGVVLLGLALTPVASRAFTEEQARQLCTGDVMRLCAAEIPNVERITACMRRQRANLSEGCRAVFGKQAASAR
ncbi:hypothetical protein [Bradyrhizobium sp.]|uniref:hypothetical protein n=1 Tax=Bradyrhizobium sp. TaxID=376 RepID=UPI0025BD2A14|nr:hypothetical protein [Bradyrhizobium sp.]